MIDVSAFVGPYPFRHVAHATQEWLLAQMDRLGIDEAWVGHLPSFLYRDPGAGNAALLAAVSSESRLRPVPAVHPGLPGWKAALQSHAGQVPAVRAYPNYWGIDPAGAEMMSLTAAAASLSCPLLLTVRFEDLRQRHRLDTVSDFPPSAVRALARLGEGVRLVVTHADRSFIEEVHYGLTPAESERVLWDVSWIWGPPEEHLRHLLATLGPARFVFGTGMPLRIPDSTVAKLDLLELSGADRRVIEEENARSWMRDG